MRDNDYREILNLEHRFIELLDDDDVSSVASMFEHGTLELSIEGTDFSAVGNGVSGATDVLASTARRRTSGSFGRHIASNHIIEIDDDTETAMIRFRTVLYYVAPGHPLHIMGLGRHEDQLTLLEGAWTITRKRIIGEVRYPPPAEL